MKKSIILLAISIAAFASCSKEVATVDEPIQNEPAATKTVTFTATVEQAEADSKATISSASNFKWESTDEVAVITAKGSKVTLSPTSISNASATFTATIAADDSIEDGAIVVFPASMLNASGKIVFPSSYDNISDAVGPYLAAEVQAGRSTLAFKYFAGAIRFHITDLPAYVTSIALNTRNSDNSADVISTGTFDIAFNEGVPVLSNGTSTDNDITVNNGETAYGSQSFVLPMPTATTQKIWIDFYKESSKLGTVSATKAFARNSFISMADLTLVSGVYFKSEDGSNWGDNETGAMTPGSSFNYTAPSFSYYPANDSDQFDFKYYVKFCGSYVKFGPDSNVAVGTTGANYNWGVNNDSSAHLNIPGVYGFSYNSISGTFSVTRSTLNLYLTGGKTDGDFTTTLDRPLDAKGHYQYKIGIADRFKVLYGASWSNSLGKNGDNWHAYPVIDGGNNFSANDYFASIVIDNNTGEYYFWDEGNNTTSSYDNLYLVGPTIGWSSKDVKLTKSAANPHIWYLEREFAKDEQVKVTDGASYYSGLNKDWGENNHSGIILENVINGDNDGGTTAKFTVAGKYLVMFNDYTQKYNIIKTD